MYLCPLAFLLTLSVDVCVFFVALRGIHSFRMVLLLATQVLGAPYVAPTLGFCGTSSVQPFFAGGTVEGRIFEGAWTGEPIGMPTVLQMSLDAMRGLQILHEAPGGPIIHNAMRPEQLLVYDNGACLPASPACLPQSESGLPRLSSLNTICPLLASFDLPFDACVLNAAATLCVCGVLPCSYSARGGGAKTALFVVSTRFLA